MDPVEVKITTRRHPEPETTPSNALVLPTTSEPPFSNGFQHYQPSAMNSPSYSSAQLSNGDGDDLVIAEKPKPNVKCESPITIGSDETKDEKMGNSVAMFATLPDGSLIDASIILNNITKRLPNIFRGYNEESITKIVNAKLHHHYDSTLLHQAVLANNPNAVKQLLSYGAEVNAKNESGRTPIHYADSANMAQFLIEGKADINAKDSRGFSILSLAHLRDNVDLVEFLLNNEADTTHTKELCGIDQDCNGTELLKKLIELIFWDDEYESYRELRDAAQDK